MGRRVEVRRLSAGKWSCWMDVMVIEGQWGREKVVSQPANGVALRCFVIVPVVSAERRLPSSGFSLTKLLALAPPFEALNVTTVGDSGGSGFVAVLSSKTSFPLRSS